MAQKKEGGSSSNGRDSRGRRLGPKLSDGQAAKPGAILVRQRGTRVYPGTNVGMGRDHTLFALRAGYVKYCTKRHNRLFVSVEPLQHDIN